MASRNPFCLSRSGVLLAVISAAFASQANAAAGRVDFATSGVTVSGTDGRDRPLVKGADLDSGDTVKTNGGRAQIRFTDGAYVSLQPNTDFSIKEYNYDGKTDGSERGFFGLAKGAMRAVTGLIGRVNRNRYQISTPTATVGIRGTGGLISVNSDGSTTITGTSGIWTLTNPAGSLDIPAGKVGVAPTTPNEPPKQTNDQVPNVGPTPPIVPTVFVQGDQRTETGEPAGVFTPLATGTGYAATVALAGFGGMSGDAVDSGQPVGSNATAVFNSAGQMEKLVFDNPNFGNNNTSYVLEAGGSHAEFGTDGILAWGRWIGPVTVTSNACEGPCPTQLHDYGPNQGLHYVVGMPTPVMPTGSAAYALVGATSPTFTNGAGAPGTFSSGGLSVNFDAQTITIGMQVSMPSDNKAWAINGTTSYTGNAFSTFASFSGSSQFGPLSIVGTAGASCACFCSADIQGFFAGANAARVGLGYAISDGNAPSSVVGAAAFKKTTP